MVNFKSLRKKMKLLQIIGAYGMRDADADADADEVACDRANCVLKYFLASQVKCS